MPDILQALLARKDKIAKMPEASQRKMWGFAFSQSVAPQLRARVAGGAQLEPEDVTKERFVTSMLDKPQPPAAEPAVAQPSALGDTQAFLSSIGSGLATRVRQATTFPTPEMPAVPGAVAPQTSWLTPGEPIGRKILQSAEGLYNENVQTSPMASKAGAAIGHAAPELAAFEAGASLVPSLEGGAANAPRIVRGAQQLLRTGAGTASMTMARGEDVSGGKLAAETIGFSVLDMLTHGFLRKTGTSGIPDVASVLQTVRKSVEKTSGVVNKESVNVFNNAFLDLVKADNPQAYERIVKGERPQDVLSLEEQVKLTNKTVAAQQAADVAAAANKKTEKIADKQQAAAAKGIEALRVKEQVKLEKQAQAIKNKAFQRELSAYRKTTGNVPAAGSEAMKSLLAGAKAKELVAQDQASVVQRVSHAKDVNDAIAVNEEAPAVTDMVKDLQALSQPTPESISSKNERMSSEIASGLKTMAETMPAETPVVTAPKVPKPGSVKAKIAASANEPLAYEKFNVVVDPTKWSTPEDVIAGKRDAIQQLITAGQAKSREITASLTSGTITPEQARIMQTQLGTDILKANRSLEKIQTPNVSRAARDRIRKGAQAAEAKRAIGSEQAGKEKIGTSSAGAEMTEQEAIDEIDTLVKIGFGSAARQAVAKRIINEVEAAGGTAVDRLEALQQAYAALKKAGK